MTRRTFLASAAARSRRPNVLWLMTDEQRPDSLRCYGSSWAYSPNLDALAAAGTVYESAYVPSPVCVPCRCSMLTGNMPSTTGVLHNNARLRAGTPFLTWRFEDAGYRTASFGKKHYFVAGRQAFQTEGGSPTEGIVDPERYGKAYDPSAHDAVFYSPSADQKAQRRWVLAGEFPTREEETAEMRNVALAKAWLEGLGRSQPFLLRLSLNAPHTPVVSPREYLQRVDPDRIRIPVPSDEELRQQPARERVHLRGFQGAQVLTPDQLRKARHYYYARAAFADAVIGRLLDWMRERGLLENTVIAMTSDHGTHLGDHGLLQKQTFYEQVATVPFIVAGPGVRKGARIRTPVSTASFLPTLLELAGLPSTGVDAPSLAKGTTARPIVSEIAFGYQGYRDADPQAMVRRGDWKLAQFMRGEPDGALYNVRSDPQELRNMYGQGLAVERELSQLLARARIASSMLSRVRALPG